MRLEAVELPLFPLNVVLFPGRPLPLHIFESRYQSMIAHCLDRDRRFGVVAIRSGHEVNERAETFGVGTIAVIERIEHLDDGRLDILTRGVERFRIDHQLDPAPYRRAEVSLLEETPLPDLNGQAALLRNLLVPYLMGLGAPPELLGRLPTHCHELAWLAAAAVQVDLIEQQHLLELDSPLDRIDATTRLLRREHGLMRHLGSVGSLRPPGPNGADLN